MLTDAEWCKNDAGNQDWKDAAEFEARVAISRQIPMPDLS